MSHFRPVRASPPPKPAAGPSSRVSDYTDETNAIGIIAPELIGLSAEEIDFIDEVVTLAPPSASTFLTVFKAYNDVLQARGPDDDRIAMLALEQAVVRDPAERDLCERQAVLLHDRLERRQRLEVGLVPVAGAVVLCGIVRISYVNRMRERRRPDEPEPEAKWDAPCPCPC